jgi:hypothetical protein
MRARSHLAAGSFDDGPIAPLTAVGRSTITQRMAARPSDEARSRERDILDNAWAQHGVSGAGAQLPYLDVIQRSFGEHDVSGVSAHFGGAAREASGQLGAHAYATGNQVAFADDTPSLFLVAHEAAHVVQQRAGVHLSSAVGAAGDVYEQHADAVAERVVRGESAADLLSAGAGGGPAIQRQEAPKETKKAGVARLLELAAKVPQLSTPEVLEAQQLLLEISEEEFRDLIRRLAGANLLFAVVGAEAAMAAKGGDATLTKALTKELVLRCVMLGWHMELCEAQVAYAQKLFDTHKLGFEIEHSIIIHDEDVRDLGRDGAIDNTGIEEAFYDEESKLPAEIEKLIDKYTATGQITVIYVPNFTNGRNGHTITPELYGKLAKGRATIILSGNTKEDTLAHELGHLLGADLGPEPHQNENGDLYSEDRLMAKEGRTGKNEITSAQVAAMRKSAYLTLGRSGTHR